MMRKRQAMKFGAAALMGACVIVGGVVNARLLNQRKSTLASIEADIALAESQQVELARLGEEYESLQSQRNGTATYTPATIIHDLTRAVSDLNAQQVAITSGEPADDADRRVIPVTVNFLASYHDVLVFVRKIEGGQDTIQLRKLVLGRDATAPRPMLTASILLETSTGKAVTAWAK